MTASRILVGALVLAACTTHDVRPAFRRSLGIDDRGISVPLPPPSLLDAPKQDVDVAGYSHGPDEIVAGTVVHVEDTTGTAVGELELAAGQRDFVVEGLAVDLRDVCLELWLVAPDGAESEHLFVSAEITAEQAIVTSIGCAQDG